jgi:RNA polymerase sigma-70 factor (ECF subfamily)
MNSHEKFNIIYNKYNKYLHKICKNYIKDEDESLDLLQDSFIKIYNNIDSINVDDCKSYLSTITINTCIDFLRKVKKNVNDVKVDDCYDIYDSSNVEYQYHDFVSFLKQKTKMLDIKSNTIFDLYIFNNYKHTEIAHKLNMNINTVRVDFMKTRRIIKDMINCEIYK